MSTDHLVDITFSIGTRAFEYTGIFKLLNDLNKRTWCHINKKQLCCCPLDAYHIPESIFAMSYGGDLTKMVQTFRSGIHLIWKDESRELKVSNLFTSQITDCIDAVSDEKCEFTVISLHLILKEGAHANYIIIQEGEAFRIEPNGFNQSVLEGSQSMRLMEERLESLFDDLGIYYISHSKLKIEGNIGGKRYGLQYVGELSDIQHSNATIQKYINQRPGLCVTYSLMYIEKMVDTFINKGYTGAELFSKSISEIDIDRLVMDDLQHTTSYKKIGLDGLLANQEISLFQRDVYEQLQLLNIDVGVTTRSQYKRHRDKIKNSQLKLALDSIHNHKDHHKIDLEMHDELCKIFRDFRNKYKSVTFEIVDIYGINLKKLYEEFELKKNKRRKLSGTIQRRKLSTKRRNQRKGQRRNKRSKSYRRHKKIKQKKTKRRITRSKKNKRL